MRNVSDLIMGYGKRHLIEIDSVYALNATNVNITGCTFKFVSVFKLFEVDFAYFKNMILNRNVFYRESVIQIDKSHEQIMFDNVTLVENTIPCHSTMKFLFISEV